MRVSVIEGDRGYDPTAAASWRVFLDGKQLRNCVTADEELGEVLCEVWDERGQPVTAYGEILHETLTGAVRLEKA
jgi:hypothetical protein